MPCDAEGAAFLGGDIITRGHHYCDAIHQDDIQCK
jgi:hypothetical protein